MYFIFFQTMLKIGGGALLVAAIVAVFVVATQGRDPDLEALEHEGREYILQLDKATGKRRNTVSLSEWAYTSNITKENEDKWVCRDFKIFKSKRFIKSVQLLINFPDTYFLI